MTSGAISCNACRRGPHWPSPTGRSAAVWARFVDLRELTRSARGCRVAHACATSSSSRAAPQTNAAMRDRRDPDPVEFSRSTPLQLGEENVGRRSASAPRGECRASCRDHPDGVEEGISSDRDADHGKPAFRGARLVPTRSRDGSSRCRKRSAVFSGQRYRPLLPRRRTCGPTELQEITQLDVRWHSQREFLFRRSADRRDRAAGVIAASWEQADHYGDLARSRRRPSSPAASRCSPTSQRASSSYRASRLLGAQEGRQTVGFPYLSTAPTTGLCSPIAISRRAEGSQAAAARRTVRRRPSDILADARCAAPQLRELKERAQRSG